MSGKRDKKKPARARMGRPLKGWEARSVVINLRVTPTEYTRMARDARKAGKTISELLASPWRDREGGE